jgi:hypothetical protein
MNVYCSLSLSLHGEQFLANGAILTEHGHGHTIPVRLYLLRVTWISFKASLRVRRFRVGCGFKN